VGAMCRVARNTAPPGSNKPDRVPMLLRLLPALVSPGRSEALRGARALVLAVRKEWVVPSGDARGGGDGAMSSEELEAVVAGISARAVAGLAERTRAAAALGDTQAGLAERTRAAATLGDMQGEADGESNLETALPAAGIVDEPVFQCLACGSPILKVDDILSSSYRILTGPAYLTSSAYNVSVSPELHEAVYTSGQYTVRDVACAGCSARLGIMYVGAVDGPNQYKVGKFLIVQEQLLPPVGVTPPGDEVALQGQLLELLRRGSTALPTLAANAPLAAPMAPAAAVATAPEAPEAPEASEAGVAARVVFDNEPLIAGAPVAAPPPPPRPRIIVTIKRYIRCILPAVRYAPMARPWWTSTNRHVAPRVQLVPTRD